MPVTRTRARAALFAIAAVVTLLVPCANAQQAKLGKVDFPTTGSDQAKAHFLRGVAALHSFWYEEALDEFREATKVDPDFAMGYWGEAMAHNHPLWSQQESDEAKRALGKIKETSKLTARERAFIEAVRVLYGDGDKQARDVAYSAAMEKLYRDNPGDDEAASFYALSLLGMVRPGEKGFGRQMKAAAIALEVFRKNPDHPGAAHYIIHAFDDPEHAVLALPAARRYAEIAPEAHHARHMPSHIFIQLGMWPEAAASNESSWAASDAWVKRKKLSTTKRDYHSLHWLLYVYLQQGRYGKAEQLLSQMRKDWADAQDNQMLRQSYARMAGAFVVETGAWDKVAGLFTAPAVKPAAQPGQTPAAGEHANHGAAAKAPYQGARPRRPTTGFFMRGMASANGALTETEPSLSGLRAISKEMTEAGDSYEARQVKIMELEILAAASAKQGKFAEAIEMAKQATALEEDMSPPSGPPDIIKPSHELLGEILLAAGRAKEAAEQFATSLRRQPNRARSLIGAARAASQSGDPRRAASAYAEFVRVWSQADSALPELREAQEYLGKTAAR